MTARRSTFTQADVTRALKAATKAGYPVASCRVTADGQIVIIFSGAPASPGAPSEWDEVLVL